MRRNHGFAVVELLVFVCWIIGTVYVAKDLQRCPEVGKTAYQVPETGEYVCR